MEDIAKASLTKKQIVGDSKDEVMNHRHVNFHAEHVVILISGFRHDRKKQQVQTAKVEIQLWR